MYSYINRNIYSRSRLKECAFTKFIECAINNCLYAVVVSRNAGELYNLYMHVIPDPSPLCEGAGY